jgi:hypothetical protein
MAAWGGGAIWPPSRTTALDNYWRVAAAEVTPVKRTAKYTWITPGLRLREFIIYDKDGGTFFSKNAVCVCMCRIAQIRCLATIKRAALYVATPPPNLRSIGPRCFSVSCFQHSTPTRCSEIRIMETKHTHTRRSGNSHTAEPLLSPPSYVSDCCICDRLCGLVVRVSGYRSRGPGFGSLRFQIFWEEAGLERGPLSLVRTTEELLGRNSSGSGLENRD